jgi:glutamine synthetase
MPGSSFSLADPNIVLNTSVAKELMAFADELEGATDTEAAISALIRRELSAHQRIIYSGNNYSDEWVAEAERRGLANLKSTDEALKSFIAEKNIRLFTESKIFTESELHSRYYILLEAYYKLINIEAVTMLQMVKMDILPAALKYRKELAKMVSLSEEIGFGGSVADTELLTLLSQLSNEIYAKAGALERAVAGADKSEGDQALATYYRTCVLPAMAELRASADKLESNMAKEYLPYPTYGDLIYDV